jgi:hypothetical protein
MSDVTPHLLRIFVIYSTSAPRASTSLPKKGLMANDTLALETPGMTYASTGLIDSSSRIPRKKGKGFIILPASSPLPRIVNPIDG